jgi:Sec-independent protein secretion pathway component TatC
VKCALLAGFVFALPVIFWQICGVRGAGALREREERDRAVRGDLDGAVRRRCVFGYTQILPLMFQFFTSYDTDWVKSAWTMHEVFKLTTSMFLAFGSRSSCR